jgi:SAM-dependent methyltransferase
MAIFVERLMMSYKVYVPTESASWDDYWQKKSIEADLSLCDTDELKPIFLRYLTKDMTLIEAGSGLGKWVITLSRLGFKIVGLDNYGPGLARVHAHEPEALQVVGSVADCPIGNNTIDAYLSLGVVEHFESGPQQPLAEAFRILKPGAIAFIEVPYDNPLRMATRLFNQLKQALKWPLKVLFISAGLKKATPKVEKSFYEYHYTERELIAFVKETGFTMVELLPKDDADPQKSIGLWLDYPQLRLGEDLFVLSPFGRLIKKVLKIFSPFIYSALIVAVVRKPVEVGTK